MLYSLGDLILALCRPDAAKQLEAIRREDPANVPKAELTLLGRPLHIIAATMAKHWNLPGSLVQLLEKKPVWPKTRPETDQRIMEGIVRAANELSYCLLNPSDHGTGRGPPGPYQPVSSPIWALIYPVGTNRVQSLYAGLGNRLHHQYRSTTLSSRFRS
jgi:hypothetical protein